MASYSLIFRSLRDAQIPFLVVGGHAVVLSGHLAQHLQNKNPSRFTFQVDRLCDEIRPRENPFSSK